jgi:hypothetical protein
MRFQGIGLPQSLNHISVGLPTLAMTDLFRVGQLERGKCFAASTEIRLWRSISSI